MDFETISDFPVKELLFLLRHCAVTLKLVDLKIKCGLKYGLHKSELLRNSQETEIIKLKMN